jgi:hypothetical protein
VRAADFHVGECKSEKSAGKLASGIDTSDYAGLQCVAWKFGDAKTPAIDLINWPASCGFPDDTEGLWQGVAEVADPNALQLRVEWNFEYPNACGGCLYDFSFKLENFEANGTLQLAIDTRSCTGDCAWSKQKLTLPAKPSGVVCRYADWRVPSSQEWPRNALFAPLDGQCDAGLAPLARGDGTQVCAVTCKTSSDCPLPGVLTCSDGLCRIAHPW